MVRAAALFVALVAAQASGFLHNIRIGSNPTCASSQCENVKTPCMDDNDGTCYPRTDPTYNVTSGQCRAGTTDCCCTSKCSPICMSPKQPRMLSPVTTAS